MKRYKWLTLVKVEDKKGNLIAAKLIRRPLNEVVKELFDMKVDITDTITLESIKNVE